MTAVAGFQVPQISQAELFAFHEAHFSRISTAHFKTTFLDGEKEEANPSGVSSDKIHETVEVDEYDCNAEEWPIGEGEALDLANDPQPNHDDSSTPADTAKQTTGKKNKKKKKKNKNNNKNNTKRPNDKPDLRKRTWDVVGDGLESLDYGDMASNSASTSAPFQRRRVKYEED